MENDKLIEGLRTIQGDKPLDEIRELMSLCYKLASRVEIDFTKRKNSREWQILLISYTDLYHRTNDILEDQNEYKIDPTKLRESLIKIFEYLALLKKQGFYQLGRNEVII